MIPIQLHCHTDYSRGDSIITIPQLVDYAKTNAMPAIAITEHGTLASSYKFWKECNNKGVKPILGCELYYAEDMARQDKEYAHIVLLAKNKEGWDNLKKISQIAYTDGFYYKPRTDFITIRKHRKGLICLTACCGGMLGHYVNLKDVPQESAYALAEANYLMLRDMFGEDLFIEFQLLRLGLARRMGEYIFNDLKTKYKDISCVVTNDIHYLNKKDFDLLNTFHAIKFKKKVSETDSSGYAECFPMNFEQLNIIRQEEYPFITEGNLVSAIEQTYAIEKRIENYSLEIGKGFVVVPQIKSDAMRYLKDKCDKGLKKIKKEDDDVYRQRLKRELGLVEQLGFADYFIVVKDLIKFCKLNEIKTGPNRGSVGGSLIAYLIGITAIDPIHFNLLFERFLNPNRVNLPDIDIDFDIQKRGTVIQYLKNKYKHVSNIISVGKFTVKTAFKGVGTALGLPFKTLNAVTQGLTLVSDDVDENMRELEMLAKEIIPDIESKYPNLFPYTKRLINMANFFGIHAAGLLIVPNTLTNWVPIRSAHGINEEADAGGLVSEYDMYDCDELGLLKLDILGLKNLTVIHNALKLIRQRHNKKININKLPLDDEKVYKLFNDGNVSGVFQFEASESMRSLIMRMCPKEFNDLSIAVALHRTPILMAQMHEEYLSRRNNFKAYDLHEDIREILKDTYGIILFQEQILEIVHKVGGLSFDEAEE
ncbi:MAG TPA: DNA polymerase III subunit alpha, partial [Ignavibacteriaceae bacterium]|nr:DNA polymerase III subunit alpha [Ignavibacteriaceae bacterium]